jgi:hypothetical protein
MHSTVTHKAKQLTTYTIDVTDGLLNTKLHVSVGDTSNRIHKLLMNMLQCFIVVRMLIV